MLIPDHRSRCKMHGPLRLIDT